MPEYFATFYAAIVLVWYLDRIARKDRQKRIWNDYASQFAAQALSARQATPKGQ